MEMLVQNQFQRTSWRIWGWIFGWRYCGAGFWDLPGDTHKGFVIVRSWIYTIHYPIVSPIKSTFFDGEGKGGFLWNHLACEVLAITCRAVHCDHQTLSSTSHHSLSHDQWPSCMSIIEPPWTTPNQQPTTVVIHWERSPIHGHLTIINHCFAAAREPSSFIDRTILGVEDLSVITTWQILPISKLTIAPGMNDPN